MFGCSVEPAGCRSIPDPANISKSDFICQTLKLLPPGSLYQRKDCNFFEFFCSIACSYYDQWQRLVEIRKEASPCTSEETVDDWLEIFSPFCDDISNELQEKQNLLCSLLGYRGQLTCTMINELLEIEGYNVTSCEVDKELCDDFVNTDCNAKTGFFKIGDFLASRKKECRHKIQGIPCTEGCCGEEEIPDVVGNDPCNFSLNQGGYCSTEACKQFRIGDFPLKTELFKRLKNPFTLCVTIDPNSPALMGGQEPIEIECHDCGEIIPGTISRKNRCIGIENSNPCCGSIIVGETINIPCPDCQKIIPGSLTTKLRCIGVENSNPCCDTYEVTAPVGLDCIQNNPGAVVPKSGKIGVENCNLLDIKICAIEILKPAHLCINYKVAC